MNRILIEKVKLEFNHPKDLIGIFFTNANKTWQIISYGYNINNINDFMVLGIKEIGGNEDILFMKPNEFAHSFLSSSISDKIYKFKNYKS